MRLVKAVLCVVALCVATCNVPAYGQAAAAPAQTPAPAEKPAVFTFQEVMVPMRDGVHLQTVIITPVNATKPLPILMQRTPYGVPEHAPDHVPGSWKELYADGYVFVFQNLRGRFKSEGVFLLSSKWILNDPKAGERDQRRVRHHRLAGEECAGQQRQSGHLRRVVLGLTAGLTLLHPHPALKAMSEQASPVDQWMNDDMHRYGALRESYAFEYSVLEEADKNANTNFDFDQYDTYSWYLKLGPLSKRTRNICTTRFRSGMTMMAHPNYDEFWKNEAWVNQLHSSTVPNLNVAGFWDQEDPWGPWQIFRHEAEHDPDHTDLMVAGPWFHGEWQTPEGDRIGLIPFGGHETALEFRRDVEAPFFRYYLHGEGDKPDWQATMFQSGSNTWHNTRRGLRRMRRRRSCICTQDGTLSFGPQAASSVREYREYVSDPANPVPYRTRPISPTYPGRDWRTWEVADQRFVENRPDVLIWESAPLDHDVTVTGPLAAKLFASTSGTDSDFMVKLIDVFPEKGQKAADALDKETSDIYADSLNGYELPIAMEVRRGRFLHSYEQPQALEANHPRAWDVPLRDHDHVFLKGHRIMVQVQSTWFPVVDRNPQKFVPSIYQATAADYVPAAQRVYSTPQMPSHIVLPVVK